MDCYLCGQGLDDSNRTIEHVLPSSIGGKLKDDALICVTCNNWMGAEIDNELEKLCRPFVSKLNLKRERGKIHPFEAERLETGEQVLVWPGWQTSLKSPQVTKEGNDLHIRAGKRKRLLQEIERLGKAGLLSDIEHAKNNVEKEIKEGGQIHCNYSVKIEKVLRSVAKIAASFYVYQSRDPEQVKELSPYIRAGGENNWAWPFNLKIGRQICPKDPIHVINVIGRKSEKILFAYIELFSTFGFFVVLNENYIGEDLDYYHVLNSRTGKTRPDRIKGQIKKSELMHIIHEKPNPNF